jgi:hypothetical protein
VVGVRILEGLLVDFQRREIFTVELQVVKSRFVESLEKP